MKRRRETEIMINALLNVGAEVNDAVLQAVNSGLKQIRREKYEERQLKRMSKKQDTEGFENADS